MIESILSIILLGIISFIGTNIDDLFILTILFSSKKFKIKEIILGQYFGIIILILISLIGYFLKFFIDVKIIGLIGIFPIFLGVKSLLSKEDSEIKINNFSNTSKIFAISLITIANGGDNIGIYAPLFGTLSLFNLILIIGIFIIMTAIWLLISYKISNMKIIKNKIKKYQEKIIPWILIGLGIYIIIISKTWNLIF
jgi:cadmium resistance transport/sequestration family protein